MGGIKYSTDKFNAQGTETGRINSAGPNTSATPSTALKRQRGFASLSPERMREIAAAGGRSAHASGRAHQFTREEARAAARRSVEVRAAKAKAKAA